jgi:hypothetical protein
LVKCITRKYITEKKRGNVLCGNYVHVVVPDKLFTISTRVQGGNVMLQSSSLCSDYMNENTEYTTVICEK